MSRLISCVGPDFDPEAYRGRNLVERLVGKLKQFRRVATRNHWRVENGLHWVLDVTFREDASRVRERNAARNLALLRKVVLNLVRADGSLKASLRGKRKHAGWDDAFMATLIAG